MFRNIYNVSKEKFCLCWEQSSSLEEVATKLNMPKPIVSARAKNYRDEGILLKYMKRKQKTALNSKLNKELEKFRKPGSVYRTGSSQVYKLEGKELLNFIKVQLDKIHNSPVR